MAEELKINKAFADKYNKYREKEELQKLKSRYGDIHSKEDDESSDSESEDDKAEGNTPSLERDFLRTLAYLKKKDPVIYDKTQTFYEENNDDSSSSSGDSKPAKPMFLKDYERKVILENEGKFVEDEDSTFESRNLDRESSLSYHEEQIKLKEDFTKALHDAETDEGELLTKRQKTKEEMNNEEKEFLTWMKTPATETKTIQAETEPRKKKVLSEVAPLKEYWTDPNLDDGERFLRDYILDKKYLDPDLEEGDNVPTYDEIVGGQKASLSESEDELFENKAEVFEHKYNFRFENPDQEFIKSYPRTIGTSVRRKEEKRKKNREALKLKAEEKKKKKQEELKQLKMLKRKEIMDKIKQLQEATGNKDLEFTDKDLEGDFDPEKYDDRMQEIFSNYDEVAAVDEAKPVFSDLEDDTWEGDGDYYEGDYAYPDYENEDFVMDCDYDPEEHQQKKEEKKQLKRLNIVKNDDKKRKKSAFFESVSKPKPVFNPNEKSFEKYLDEYYALDYEDLIGDLPCRFKYRQVVPNDFGLSTDEILVADDKELNAWCSLKRAIQYRSEEEEHRDVAKYRRKANNAWKKARVLKSVYKQPGEDDSDEGKVAKDSNNNTDPSTEKRKKMNSRKRRRLRERAEKLKVLEMDTSARSSMRSHRSDLVNGAEKTNDYFTTISSSNAIEVSEKKNARKKRKPETALRRVSKLSDERLKAYGLEPKKFLKKLQYGTSAD